MNGRQALPAARGFGRATNIGAASTFGPGGLRAATTSIQPNNTLGACGPVGPAETARSSALPRSWTGRRIAAANNCPPKAPIANCATSAFPNRYQSSALCATPYQATCVPPIGTSYCGPGIYGKSAFRGCSPALSAYATFAPVGYCSPAFPYYPVTYTTLYGGFTYGGGGYGYYDYPPEWISPPVAEPPATAPVAPPIETAEPSAAMPVEPARPAPANGDAARLPRLELERMRELGFMLGQGDAAFQQGNYEDARAEYRRAVAIAPEAARAHLAFGLAAFACGAFSEASAAIRAGVAGAPVLARSAVDLAQTYGRTEDFQAHRAALDAHVAANSSDLDARFLAGFVHLYSGDRDGGIALLRAYRDAPGADQAVRAFIDGAERP